MPSERRLGRTPGLAVQVAEHAPEARHRRRRHVDAELRQVGLDVPLHRLQPPGQAVGIARGEERAREADAQPEPRQLAGADLHGVESADLDDLHAPGQRLARLPQQRR